MVLMSWVGLAKEMRRAIKVEWMLTSVVWEVEIGWWVGGIRVAK